MALFFLELNITYLLFSKKFKMADPYKSILLNEFHQISSLKIVQQIDKNALKKCLLSVNFSSLIFGHLSEEIRTITVRKCIICK